MSILRIFLALTPILAVLYLMIWRRWNGSQAGLAGYLVAAGVGVLFFGATLPVLAVAFGKAIFLALYVLYIIWMALFLYNVINDAGAIKAIGTELPHLAEDRGAQSMLLAWVFGSFLQGASGFGVPAAVVAPLLVSLGFVPTVAVVVALVGHAWAVSFGSLGTSFVTLVAASGVEEAVLAGPSAVLLGFACLLCGGFVLWRTDGWRGLARRWWMLMLVGGVIALAQFGIARLELYSLVSFGASLIGLVLMVVLLSVLGGGDGSFSWRRLGVAFFPYFILTAIILLGKLVFDDWLNQIKLGMMFPAVETTQGWATPTENARSISLFGHPGALLLYSSLIVWAYYKWRGVLSTSAVETYDIRSMIQRTIKRSTKSTISIIALVAMGTTMQHAGMTQLLADTLSNTGAFFPFLSPFIGGLGAFMTGSNTNSNVVFADLQKQTALALELSVPYILAAQTSGGALGSIFAPAKVVVGVSTVEGAEEGAVLQQATLYGLIIIAILGGLTLFFA